MTGSNFRFIDTNVDVSKILKQVLENPDDWQAVHNYQNIAGDKSPYGFLPLTMAVVDNPTDNPKNSERQANTPLFTKYNEAIKWLRSIGIKQTSRMAFFRLKVGGGVGRHIDEGTYYLTRDRYHLSLQGRYQYEVDGEVHIIEPGTFFWFDNKKFHESKNIDTVERITLVFDVPHSHHHPNNSRNFI